MLLAGMSGPVDNLVVVSAFHARIGSQAVIALVLLAVAVTARVALGVVRVEAPEHPARRVLRVGFGLLWLADGLLQLQQGMPTGLPAQLDATAASSPAWLQHLVADGTGLWTRHPVPVASSAVWIQVGLGLLLLLAPRWRPSQVVGGLSVAWALVVWVGGEAAGGILAPGLSWLTGAPGPGLLYAAAGVLLALPASAWTGRRLGRGMLAVLGAGLLALGVLQAWPGRGSWQGAGLAATVSGQASMSQPAALVCMLHSFSSFVAGHGGAVNLVVVAVLVGCGATLLSGRRRPTRVALLVLIVASLAAWVLVTDLGILGGLGTDPGNMPPIILLAAGAWLAWTRDPAVASAADAPATAVAPSDAEPTERRPVRVGSALGVLATLAAVGVVVIGVVPIAEASVDPRADAVVTMAINGTPDQIDTPAPPFDLVDQTGRPTSLTSFAGRTVALTFLDPVCTTDCPLIAQEMRVADEEVGRPSTTAFVAIVANPIYRGRQFVQAFDRQERLQGIGNWYFLTGSLPELRKVWNSYGLPVQTTSGGGMVAHSDSAFVIDTHGRLRATFGADPGGDGNTGSSLATVLSSEVNAAVRAG